MSARNGLLSIEEYERLTKRNQQAVTATDTLENIFADIGLLAAGSTK